jgi:hypothetical protein
MNYCIIGLKHDALRAASLCSSYSKAVTLCHPILTDNLLDDPSHGIYPVKNRQILEQIYGPLVDVSAPKQLSMWDNQIYDVPIRKRTFIRNSKALHRSIFKEQIRCLANQKFSSVTGDAQEERSMYDWLNRRVGGILTEHMYTPYAQSRWGMTVHELSNTLARKHFYPQSNSDYIAMGGTHISRQTRLYENLKTELVTHHTKYPTGLEMKKDGLWTIHFENSSIEHEGPLLLAVPFHTILDWLDLPTSIQTDIKHLKTKDLNILKLTLSPNTPAHDIHVFDSKSPYYRICFPYGEGETALVHLSQPDCNTHTVIKHFEKLNLGTLVEGQFPQSIVLKDWTPVWTKGCLARVRRIIRYLDGIGITMIGRHGAFSEQSIGDELYLLEKLLKNSNQAEQRRLNLDPDPRTNDAKVSIGFVGC